jgi:hypothetical protein
MMESKFYSKFIIAILIGIAVLFTTQSNAQFSNVPVTGYNADVIANGVGSVSSSTTATFDNTQYTLAASDWNFNGSCAAISFFVPNSGTINANSTVAPGLVYNLQPYNANNDLRIPASGSGTGSGTLTVTTPARMSNIYLLYAAGNGPISAGINVTITFTDASTQVFSNLTALDWFATTNPAISNLGRVDRTATPACATTATGGPQLFDMALAISPSNYSKFVQSVTIDKTTSGATMNIMAVGMMAPCVTPIDQATVLTQGATTTSSIAGSFTAAASSPTGYLVVGYLNGSIPTSPVNGTTYNTGQLLGSGKVIQASSSTSFSASGLTGGTNYDVYVYSYNTGATCGGPIYNTTSVPSATWSTNACSGLAGGTYSVGPTGTYLSITAAMAAVNGGITGPVILELQSAYVSSVETFPIVFPSNSCIGPINTLTIRPETGATALSITSNNTTGTINFNGANFITIDGRPGGIGTTPQLSIANTNAGTSYAALFNGDASFNTIKYCTVTSRNTSTTSGTIAFTTGTVSGNDGNTVDNCSISDDLSGSFPLNAIYSAGTSSSIDNSGNVISNNNISNYFSAASVTNGVLLTATGNSGWSVINNRLFQTANRIYTTAQTHNGINILSGSGYTISGNIIGFANASGTGTTNIIGNSVALTGTFPSSYTVTGTANATRYIAINCAFTAGGIVSNIQGNTIGGFALYTSSGANTTNGIWCGINISSGNANVGTTTSNTIGSTSGLASIYTACTTTGGTAVGIFATSANTITIQNNTIGAIDASGTSASLNGGITGIDVAGTSGIFSITGNTIGNSAAGNLRTGFIQNGSSLGAGGSTLTSTTGATAGLVGIRSAATGTTLNISNNTLRGFITSSTVTAFTGITSTGGNTASVLINNNLLGTSAAGLVNYTVANSGALTGINLTGSTSAISHSIQTNDFRGIVYNVAGSGSHTYIITTAGTAAGDITTIASNTFSNLNVNTTGTITFISQSYSASATGTKNTNNNSIVTGYVRGGASGSIILITDNGSSVAGCISNCQNNNFSNITVSGTTTITGLNYTDGGTAATRFVTGNTLSNWIAGTGAINTMNFTYWNGASSLSNNSITGIAGQSSITGITIGATVNTANPLTLSNNTINNLVSSGTGGNVTGITCSNTSPVVNITGNSINTLSSTGVSSTVVGIAITAGTNTSVFGNIIIGLSGTGTTSPICNGITVSGGTLVNVYKNKISNLSESGAIATTSGAVNGILLSGGTTVNVYNNLIGNLTTPAANLADAIRGIAVTSTTGSSSYNLYYNNIYLNASSTGAAFGTTGIYHSASATATTAKLDLRNNIIVNSSTPAGAGITSALRRSAAATYANWASTSDRNLLVAGTLGANNAILNDNGTVYPTSGSGYVFPNYQSTIASRDANSFSSEPGFTYSSPGSFFQSVTGTDAGFLHLVGGISTLCEGGAIVISAPNIADDYDGDIRNVSFPDIGADEFNGISPAPSITLNSITPGTASQCSATARTISVDATTPSGTITGVTISYSYNSVNQGTFAMSNSSGNTWTYTIPAPSSPTNATVAWSITATNSIPLSRTLTGPSYSDEPLFGATASITASPSAVCTGSTSSLNMIVSKPGSGAVGSGSTTSSTYPNPIYSNWANNKMQILYLASELSSAGFSAGNFTLMSLNLTSTSTTGRNNFTINMANTSASALTTTFLTPAFTQVYTNTSYVPFVGTNSFAFGTGAGSSPNFTWDGTSNLVLQICWDNIASTATESSTCTADNTSFTSVVSFNRTSTTGTSVCGISVTGSLTYTVRPNLTFTGNKASAVTSYLWSDGISTIGTSNPITVAPSSSTTYSCTATASGCPITASLPVNVFTTPSTPTATNSTECSIPVTPSCSVTSTSGLPTPTFKWYDAATGGNLLQTSTSTTFTSSINTTRTFYVSEINGICESPRVAVTATLPTLTTNSSNNLICSTGGSIQLTAPLVSGATYTWTGAGLDCYNCQIVNASPTVTTIYTVSVTAPGCSANFTVNVGVISGASVIPSANPTSTCYPGGASTVQLNSNLSAGNFGVSSIPYAPVTVPGSGVTSLVTNGTANVALSSGSLDDGGWGSIPLGFNYNFFGTNFTSVNVGTNGVMQFGAYNSTAIAQYAFVLTPQVFPNASNPLNVIAYLANDMIWSNAGENNSIKYWNDGIVPTRRFIIQFTNGRNYNSAGALSTVQLILYETSGIVEIHITNAAGSTPSTTEANCRKTIGLQNGNASIGAVAPGWSARTSSLTTSEAWRFSPPANYTYLWTPSANLGNTTASSVNYSVTGAGSFTYNVQVTNPTTGCVTTSPVSFVVNPTPIAPTVTPSSTNILAGQTASFTASQDPGNTVNWYTSSTGGSPIATTTNFTTPILCGNTSLVPYYSNDFSSGSGIATLSGVTSIGSGALTLYPNTTSQQGGITVPAQGTTTTSLQVDFDATTAGASVGNMADGFSYSFADDADATLTTYGQEEGTGSRLRISFDAYGTTDPNIQGIYLLYNETGTSFNSTDGAPVLAYSSNTSWLNSGSQHYSISVNSSGQLTLTIGSTTIFNNVQLPAAYLAADKSTWKHVIAGRTGAVSMGVTIDNLVIQTEQVSSPIVTYYVSQSNTVCESSRATATVNITPIAAPSVSGNLNVCGNNSTTLTSSSPSGPNIIKWYNVATGGTALAAGTTFTTPPASGAATYYAAEEGVYCSSSRTAVTVNWMAPPSFAIFNSTNNSTSSVVFCGTSGVTPVNLDANIASATSWSADGSSYSWSQTIAGGLNCTGLCSSANSVNLNNILPSNNSEHIVVTVTDPLTGCIAISTVDVTAFQFPAFTATASPTSICPGNSTQLSTDISPIGNYTFSWSSNPSGFTSTASNPSVTPNINTTYTVLVTNIVTGCQDSRSVTVVVNDPQVTSTTPGATACGDGAVTLQATSSSGSTLNWYSNSSGGTILGTGSSFTTPVITADANYYVEAVSGIGNITGLGNTSIPTDNSGWTAQRGIVFNASTSFTLVSAQYYSSNTSVTNTVTVVLQNNVGTQLQTTTLNIAQGTSPGWYTMNLNWNITSGTGYRLLASFSSTVQRDLGANYSLSTYNNLSPIGTITSGYDGGISTTTYNYFHNIAITAGCASARVAVLATHTNAPSIIVAATNSTVCAGSASQVSVSSSNPGYSYTWTSNPSGFNQTGTGPFTVNPTVTTTYNVVANDPSSSCASSSSITVTTTPNNLTASATATPSSVCQGGNSQLNALASEATGVDAYSFAASSGTFTPVTGATAATLASGSLDDGLFTTITLPFSFNYGGASYTQVTPATNGTLFLGASGTTTTVNSLSANAPRPFIAPLSDDLDAISATVSYVTNGSIGNRIFTFEWLNMEWYYNVTGGPTMSFQCNLYEANGKIEFIYRQEAGPLGGVSESASIGLAGSTAGNFLSLSDASGSPTASSITETTTINIKPATGQIYAFTPPLASSLSYLWSPSTFLTSTNIANPVAQNATSSQTYTVVVTNSSGCSRSATATLSVASSSLTSSSITYSSAPICGSSNFTATAHPSGGGSPYTYSWSDGIGGIYPNAQTITANLAAGTYSFTCLVTDPCSNSSTNVNVVTVNPTPVIAVSPTSATYCSNGAPVSLTASGASSYSWSPSSSLSASTGASVNANPTATTLYTVIGSTVSGCTASSTTNVIFSVGPTASASVSPTAVCPGDLVTLTGSGNLPAVGDYSVASIPYAPLTSGTTSAGPAGDDALSAGIALPFAFNFFGTSYNTLYISTNGFITFNSAMGAACCTGNFIPSGSIYPYIALDWQDLNTNIAGNIDYFTLTSPNRFVVRWNGVSVYTANGGTGSCDGQIILYQNGTVEIHSGFINTVYNAQTQGIQDGTGFGTAAPGRNSIVGWSATNDAYRFTPPSSTLTYQWTANPSAAITNSTSANATANPVAATTYTLAVSGGACTTTATTVQVTMNSAPVSISASSSTVCKNGSAITLSSNFDGPYATYSGNGVTGNTFNPTDPTVTIGNNTVTVTYTPPTGCPGTASMQITVLGLPVPNATNTTLAAPKCEGITVALQASPSGSLSPYSISWAGPGFGYLTSQSITPPSNVGSPVVFSGASGQSLPGISGPYVATVTDARGCTNTATTVLTVHSNPTVLATVTSPVCAGTSVTFTGNVDWHGETPASYVWFNPLGDNIGGGPNYTISNVSIDDAADLTDLFGYPGYSFTASNAAGCSNDYGFSLHVIGAPVFDGSPGDQTVNNNAGNCSAVVNYGPVTASSNEYWYTASGYGFGDEYSQSVPTNVSYVFSSGPSGSGDGSGSTFLVGTTHVAVTATNGCTNLDAVLGFDVTVIDNQAPVITATGDNTPLTCNPTTSQINAALGSASATDNCGVGTPSYTDSPISSNGCDRCKTRTWNVTDVNGNPAAPVSRQICWIEDHDTPELILTSNASDLDCNPGAETIDFYLGHATLQSNMSLPPHCLHTFITETNGAVSHVGCNYQQTRYWVATNNCSGNTSTASHTVYWIVDTQAPVISSVPANTTVSCAGSVPAANDASVVATDNCESNVQISHDADVISNMTCPNRYTITRTYHATDHCGNTSNMSQIITVNDQTGPIISCPANIVLPACGNGIATWTSPTATDNCSGGATVSQSAGPAPGSTFGVGSTTTIIYTATDACGNTSNCSFTVTRRTAIALNAGIDENTYYGYSADQAFTHTLSGVSGGTLPYNYSWTFVRLTGASLTPLVPVLNNGAALRCNMVNSSGDEIFNVIGSPLTYGNAYWTCSSQSTANWSAPAYPIVSGPTATSINLMMLDTVKVICTITDADGCQASDDFVVFAEDARCWAGNSTIQKVTICHRNANNTCATICVDESAVAAHLAHGDALGQCPRTGCPTGGKLDNGSAEVIDATSYLTAYPNPFNDKTTIAFSVPKDGRAVIRIYDAVGKEIGILFDGMAKSGEMYKVDFDGSKYAEGMYFYSITSDEMNQTKKMQLIK